MEKYRIEDIKSIIMSRKKYKIFKAYEYSEKNHSYVFCGEFTAPENVAAKNLHKYITDESENI